MKLIKKKQTTATIQNPDEKTIQMMKAYNIKIFKKKKTKKNDLENVQDDDVII